MQVPSTPEASLVPAPGGNECHTDCSNTSIMFYSAHWPIVLWRCRGSLPFIHVFHFFYFFFYSFSLSLSVPLSPSLSLLALNFTHTHTHTLHYSSLCLSALPAAVSPGELHQHLSYLWPGAYLLQHELLQMVSGYCPQTHMQWHHSMCSFTITVDIVSAN